jgi:hypothetical protein
MEPAGKYASR